MKSLRTAAVLLGLAAYLAAFCATPLPDLLNAKGEPLWRIGLLGQIGLLPDDYLLSNWFGSPPQFTLADRLPVLLVAGAILAWAAALGWLLLAVCRAGILPAPPNAAGGTPAPQGAGRMPALQQLTHLETFVFATAAGLATLSTWVLLLGLFGLLQRTWTFAVPAALTLLAAGWVWRRRTKPRPVVAPRIATTGRGFVPETDDILPVRWLWLALPFVLAILLAAMLPPFDFDVCEYHLQAPKEFYQQGRITFLPHNAYANMAMGTEMLSLLAMVVAGDWWLGALAGKTVIATFTPLCALALYCAGRRFYSTSVGVAAALLYISMPWVASTSIIPSAINISSSGLVEGALACYLFLAVYAVVLYGGWGTASQPPSPTLARSTHPTSLLLLAGYLAGAAVAAKYPAALLVLLPLAVWVFVGRQKSNSRGLTAPGGKSRNSYTFRGLLAPGYCELWFLSSAKRTVVFLLAAAVCCGLWFGKNWALTGNPTYPLLYGALDGKTWNAEKDARWNRVHRPHDFSAATLGKDLGRVVLSSPWLSPLVVPLAALALLGWRKRSKRSGGSCTAAPRDANGPAVQLPPQREGPLAAWRALAWQLLAYAAFVIAVWWLLTHRIDRFWIPVLPVLALLAGAGACWSTDRWWRWLLRGLLLAGLAANFLVAAAGPGNAWFVPLATLRRDWTDPWHGYFNAHAAEGGVLAVGDAAVFDLQPPVLYNTCFDDCIFEQMVKGKTPGEIRAGLAARHIAYVYVNWGEIARYRSPGNYGFTDFVQPAVFDRLVEQGVLKPIPEKLIKDHPGQAYWVLAGE